jgi:hypothetical protein
MAFTREQLLQIADNADKAGDARSATDAMQMLKELDASTSEKTIADFENDAFPNAPIKGANEVRKLGITLGDMLSAGTHGLSFGLDDRAAAGLHTLASNIGSTIGVSDDIDYDQALAQEQTNTRARQTRLNHLLPGSSGVLEAGGSLFAPGGLLLKGAEKIGLGTGKLVSAIANTVENAGFGAASAYGHGQDPATGAAVGAAGTALQPLVRYGAPVVSRLAGGTAGAAIGGRLAGFPGAWAGGELGRRAGSAVGRGAEKVMDSNPGRGLLAKLAAAPGRLYGWATGL